MIYRKDLKNPCFFIKSSPRFVTFSEKIIVRELVAVTRTLLLECFRTQNITTFNMTFSIRDISKNAASKAVLKKRESDALKPMLINAVECSKFALVRLAKMKDYLCYYYYHIN